MPPTDPFEGQNSLTAPARDGDAITPDDNNDLAVACRGIIVTVAGNVEVVTPAGNTVIYPGLAAGIVHPLRATRIKAAGTTATGIVVVW